jgi:hypothetical protein
MHGDEAIFILLGLPLDSPRWVASACVAGLAGLPMNVVGTVKAIMCDIRAPKPLTGSTVLQGPLHILPDGITVQPAALHSQTRAALRRVGGSGAITPVRSK